MPELLFVPYLGTAEKEVVLVDWLVAEGDSYAKGQPLCLVETLKASFEIEAEEAGVLLRKLAVEGDRVPLQAPLAFLGGEGEGFSEEDLKEKLRTLTSPPEVPGGEDPRGGVGGGQEARRGAAPKSSRVPAAPAARKKARSLGIDLATVRGTGPSGLVRLEDVLAAAQGDGAGAGGGEEDGGFLDPGFLAFLRAEGESFGRLSSDFRLALYRKHGAMIGPSSFLGEGSLILAERIVLGSGFRLGAGGRIEAEELRCGDLVQFGARLRLRCRRVEIGSNAYFAPDVEIGGGGAMDPEALLRVGSHGFVGEHVHLNPCRPLVLGDEVVVSRQASLMTHSFGLDILEGYPNRFAGVTIEDCCQIGISCTLFPGVRMGKGSILLSGSSLVTDVPGGRLFGGVPAKDMKAARRELSPRERVGLAAALVEEFARQLQLRGLPCEESGGTLRCQVEGRLHLLAFLEELGDLPEGLGEGAAEWILVSPKVAEDLWERFPGDGILVDLGAKRIQGTLGPLAASFREFLRKRGVRLSPRTWTYEGGWL